MPFPKRLLLDGETVALDLRPHWWFFAGPLFAGIPVLALLVVALKQNGDAVQQEIYRQMGANAARAMGGAPRQQSVTDQIAALADLRDRGAISPAEYEAKKAQLLDRL